MIDNVIFLCLLRGSLRFCLCGGFSFVFLFMVGFLLLRENLGNFFFQSFQDFSWINVGVVFSANLISNYNRFIHSCVNFLKHVIRFCLCQTVLYIFCFTATVVNSVAKIMRERKNCTNNSTYFNFSSKYSTRFVTGLSNNFSIKTIIWLLWIAWLLRLDKDIELRFVIENKRID